MSARATAWIRLDDLGGVHERQLMRWARESAGDPILDGDGRPVGELTGASIAGGVLRLRAELDEGAGRGVAVAITERADGSAVADVAAVASTDLSAWSRDPDPRAEARPVTVEEVERRRRVLPNGAWTSRGARISAT
jgi:hypothetical protein